MTKPEAPEFQIERDYDNQCDHARSMYHMAVQRAEAELDLALGVADETRQARLAELRHSKPLNCPTCGSPQPSMHPAISGGGEVYKICPDPWHEPNGPTLEDVAMIARKAAIRVQAAVTRMADLP